jgi:Coenzyme PQQ synthesis protein D (PqqD)
MADPLLTSRITVPEHVVRRQFPDETVVLNLQSGRYHGLNATATAMLDALEGGATPGDAAARIAGEAGVEVGVVQRDILALVSSLAERGLVEVDGAGGG